MIVTTAEGKPLSLYGASHALVVGVSNYTNGWWFLREAVNDAREVKAVLERQNFNVTLVENPNAARLKAAIENFVAVAGQNKENRLLFYFAGHGHTLKMDYGGDLGYIVPSDAPLPNKDRAGFQLKAISMENFSSYARGINAKHALFLFDSCFSGSIFALSRAVPDAITYKTREPVRQFITAGSADETVPDKSIFKQQFLAAIKGEADKNQDNYVTGAELGEFLQTQVINYSRESQHPQYGKIRDPQLDKGDFVFVVQKPLPRTAVYKPNAQSPEVKDSMPPSAPVVLRVYQPPQDMIRIPAASFEMGSNDTNDADIPVHRVEVDEFYLDKYEVTVAKYKEFLKANSAQITPNHWDEQLQKPNRPVVYVSWNDAVAYCEWLSKQRGKRVRLPTEAEWEFAARGRLSGKNYPWGNNISATKANFNENRNRENDWENANYYLRDVGSYTANNYGLYDMAGSVWEWCADWYSSDYYQSSSSRNPKGPDNGIFKVLRGGSWNNGSQFLRCAYRGYLIEPASRNNNVGFRCAQDVR